MSKGRNCWEIKKCGREPEGEHADRGACPAAVDHGNNGVNGGRNAGRYCWRIAGTYCSDEVQGVFAQKVDDCGCCEVFKEIMLEEGLKFKI